MGEKTNIAWCDKTWSPWIGCTQISDGCKNCYAKAIANRFYEDVKWGKKYRRNSKSYWEKPIAWNKRCQKLGIRERVFPSMCDPFDEKVSQDWFEDFVDLIKQTPNLDWILLTKRPENIDKMIYDSDILGGGDYISNIWIGITCENQKAVNERLPILLNIPASHKFISCEPLLEEISLGVFTVIDEVYVGCESGADARPMRKEWADKIKMDCEENGVKYFLKQEMIDGKLVKYQYEK